MPACHPRALHSSLFPANRMHSSACLGSSLCPSLGRYATPGASTGAKRVRQLPRATARCSRQRSKLLFSCPAAWLAREPALVQGAAHRRLPSASLVPGWYPECTGLHP
jgi:hypothetical protein